MTASIAKLLNSTPGTTALYAGHCGYGYLDPNVGRCAEVVLRVWPLPEVEQHVLLFGTPVAGLWIRTARCRGT